MQPPSTLGELWKVRRLEAVDEGRTRVAVICVCETKMRTKDDHAPVGFYLKARSDRENPNGGGVAIYVREELAAERIVGREVGRVAGWRRGWRVVGLIFFAQIRGSAGPARPRRDHAGAQARPPHESRRATPGGGSPGPAQLGMNCDVSLLHAHGEEKHTHRDKPPHQPHL